MGQALHTLGIDSMRSQTASPWLRIFGTRLPLKLDSFHPVHLRKRRSTVALPRMRLLRMTRFLGIPSSLSRNHAGDWYEKERAGL